MSLAAKLPWTHRFAGGFPGLSSQPLPTDADAIEYLTRVAAADGADVETGVAAAVDAFFRHAKESGVFDALKACCILAGARTLAGALVPVVGDAPTNVANGFVSGDYSRTAGLTGDGTSYLDSGYTFASSLQNNMHMAAYLTPKAGVGFDFLTSGYSTSSGFYNCSLYADTTTVRAIAARDPFAGIAEITVADTAGFAGASRSSSSSVYIRAGGSQESDASPSTGVPGYSQYMFARNTDGAANNIGQHTLLFYSLGESVDLESLDTAVTNLITAIGEAL